jgi:hypothetical protein
MISIFTHEKSFADPWIGHPGLNRRFGLHRRRMALADGCRALRCALHGRGKGADAHMAEALDSLQRDGCAAVENFLPEDAFADLAREAEAAMAAAAEAVPPTRNRVAGFGAPTAIPGGFDRYDGGTLNRFLDLDRARLPALATFASDPRLSLLARASIGRGHLAEKTQLYLTLNDDDAVNRDDQRDMHRDTFFSSMKFWFFLRPVGPEDGPFEYVPGSHRLDARRLAWEGAEALTRLGPDAPGGKGGAFRIAEERLADLGLPPPRAFTCPANTLVLADTLGFHRRGQAKPGTERLSVYGWRRPWPFAPV